MNQPFKIRKNKSQKDIKLTLDQHKVINQHIVLHNCLTQNENKSIPKQCILEPLKNKLNIIQNFIRRGQKRLDFTQPVNIKKHTGSKCDSRYQVNPIGQESNIPFKPSLKDKQNRPCSMNDLKYNNTLKVKSNFYNTQKYESLKLFPSILKSRFENDTRLQKIDEQGREGDSKSSKNKSQKLLSQIPGKINKKQHRQALKTKTESQQQQIKQQYSFRKSLLYELLEKNKANCYEKSQPNTITIKPYFEQKFGQLSVIQSNISELQENHETPMINKQMSIFEADCSTIRNQKDNQSSFISNRAINYFIKPAQEITLPSIQEKTHVEKKKRLEIDKIRKKFPQNFFK